MYYLERWLRLTPAYFMVLMIYIYLLPHIQEGVGPSGGHLQPQAVAPFCIRIQPLMTIYIPLIYS